MSGQAERSIFRLQRSTSSQTMSGIQNVLSNAPLMQGDFGVRVSMGAVGGHGLPWIGKSPFLCGVPFLITPMREGHGEEDPE
jgi:hypothetical protein